MREEPNTMRNYRRILSGMALAGMLPLAGCGGFMDVTNPGPIEDDALNSVDAVPSLVAGMSGDLSIVLDDIMRLSGIASDDLAHGGSYTAEGLWYRGIIRAEDVDYEWSAAHRARWVAEQGLERMKKIEGYNFETNVLTARAYLLAGFSNRMLGENMCQAVFDGGKAEPHTAHFSRAEAQFTEALRIAQAARNGGLQNAALAGRASVRAWQGKWAEAVQDAQKVPTSFQYDAVFSTNSSRETNSLVQETYGRREFTVFNTPWAKVFGDPRVQWDTVRTASGAIQKGQDGKTNFFRQKKFTDLGSDVALAKGTEMLMLRAEAALRAGDIAGAFRLINQQRAFYRMEPLAAPSTPAAAWKTLQAERGAVLWLEGRRLWDLRRWHEDAIPAARNGFLQGRDKCIPISKDERDSNPNLG